MMEGSEMMPKKGDRVRTPDGFEGTYEGFKQTRPFSRDTSPYVKLDNGDCIIVDYWKLQKVDADK